MDLILRCMRYDWLGINDGSANSNPTSIAACCREPQRVLPMLDQIARIRNSWISHASGPGPSPNASAIRASPAQSPPNSFPSEILNPTKVCMTIPILGCGTELQTRLTKPSICICFSLTLAGLLHYLGR